MKKRTPVYQEIREILKRMYGTIERVYLHSDYLGRLLQQDWYEIGRQLDLIERRYKAAAKKSSGPRKTTEKKARASRENLRKAVLALTPEQRSERARKAVSARWAKAKEK